MSVEVKLICVLLAVLSVNGRLNVNVALNRPSYLSSQYPHGPYPPSKGNDGDKSLCSALISPNSVAITDTDTNPSYTVDLGVALNVDGVKLTNRGDALLLGYRANNFVIGLTDVSPTVALPTLWNYDVCGQYPGTVPDGATVSLKCAGNLPARRYVVLQMPVTDRLNICELEIFVRRIDWKVQAGHKMTGKEVSTFQVKHHVQCPSSCTMSPVCDSYNYRAADKTCQLNTHDTPLIANSADIVADSDWSWCSTSFTYVA